MRMRKTALRLCAASVWASSFTGKVMSQDPFQVTCTIGDGNMGQECSPFICLQVLGEDFMRRSTFGEHFSYLDKITCSHQRDDCKCSFDGLDIQTLQNVFNQSFLQTLGDPYSQVAVVKYIKGLLGIENPQYMVAINKGLSQIFVASAKGPVNFDLAQDLKKYFGLDVSGMESEDLAAGNRSQSTIAARASSLIDLDKLDLVCHPGVAAAAPWKKRKDESPASRGKKAPTRARPEHLELHHEGHREHSLPLLLQNRTDRSATATIMDQPDHIFAGVTRGLLVYGHGAGPLHAFPARFGTSNEVLQLLFYEATAAAQLFDLAEAVQAAACGRRVALAFQLSAPFPALLPEPWQAALRKFRTGEQAHLKWFQHVLAALRKGCPRLLRQYGHRLAFLSRVCEPAAGSQLEPSALDFYKKILAAGGREPGGCRRRLDCGLAARAYAAGAWGLMGPDGAEMHARRAEAALAHVNGCLLGRAAAAAAAAGAGAGAGGGRHDEGAGPGAGAGGAEVGRFMAAGPPAPFDEAGFLPPCPQELARAAAAAGLEGGARGGAERLLPVLAWRAGELGAAWASPPPPLGAGVPGMEAVAARWVQNLLQLLGRL